MNEEQVSLWKSQNCIFKLLQARGYDVSECEKMTTKAFREKMKSKSDEDVRREMTIILRDQKSLDDILVVWLSTSTLGVNLREVYAQMQDEKCSSCIIVLKNSPCTRKGVTPWCACTIKKIRANKEYISVYTEQETCVDIMGHRLTPKYEICTSKEKNAILKDYAVTSNQVQKMLLSDPIAKYLGLKKGMMIRIIRDSVTQIGLSSTSYRVIS